MAEGWTETTLGEVSEVLGGGTPSTKEARFWGGRIPWITPSEITRQDGHVVTVTERTITEAGLAASAASLLPVNAVLLTSRATVGAVALAGVPMATNQGFASLVVRNGVLPRFLMYWVQANRVEFESRAGGSTFPEISRTKVKAIPIRVPPLATQWRIVDLISALDVQIASLVIEAGRALELHSCLAETLIGGAGPATQVHALAHPNRGLVGGPFGSSLTTKHYASSGVPVIRGTNMPKIGRFIGGDFIYVSSDKAELLKGNLARPGDVVFTQRGTLGQVGIVSDRHASLVVSQSQMRLRVDPTVAVADYVFFAFARPSMVRSLKEQNTATANPHINLGILAKQEIPLPDLDSQSRIVSTLLRSLELVERLTSEVAAQADVRSSMLSALLMGEVEIPDSYDSLLADAV